MKKELIRRKAELEKKKESHEKSPGEKLEELVKSHYDYTTNAFPKGEQAVITACEKEFGDKSVPYAEKMIGRLLGGKDPEMERIKKLSGPISLSSLANKHLTLLNIVVVCILLCYYMKALNSEGYNIGGLTMATLAEIRAKLKEQEANTGGNRSSGGDNAIYPFWNMKEGQTATVLFLPMAMNPNTFFWQERLLIKLPFAGIKGETDSRPVQVQVPCMEMYGETCPVLSRSTWMV